MLKLNLQLPTWTSPSYPSYQSNCAFRCLTGWWMCGTSAGMPVLRPRGAIEGAGRTQLGVWEPHWALQRLRLLRQTERPAQSWLDLLSHWEVIKPPTSDQQGTQREYENNRFSKNLSKLQCNFISWYLTLAVLLLTAEMSVNCTRCMASFPVADIEEHEVFKSIILHIIITVYQAKQAAR